MGKGVAKAPPCISSHKLVDPVKGPRNKDAQTNRQENRTEAKPSLTESSTTGYVSPTKRKPRFTQPQDDEIVDFKKLVAREHMQKVAKEAQAKQRLNRLRRQTQVLEQEWRRKLH